METAFILYAAKEIQQAILTNENTLESLDRAIGDGDHYINMKRGANAIIGIEAELAQLSPEAALNKIGLKLLSTIGGASGPLLASFFISMAKQLPNNNNDHAHLKFVHAFAAGVQAIMQRGKADLGEKTMLDVLIPVSNQWLLLAQQNHDVAFICSSLITTAEQGMLATKDLIASKGRAAGLGERAIGHIDPGAKSCQLMITAVCNLILKS
ncbi:MAG: dihydroxyacetone kinase subunit L [Methylotenera sp.]|nr:dihydroxyacetone kinase subunit L [Methylotenera sp.]MSP99092.1 dihydroxyacetone kinase subunit L [Methylotenera sp.]